MLPWVSEFLSIILQVSDDEVAVTTQDLRHLQAVHAILKNTWIHQDSQGAFSLQRSLRVLYDSIF